MACALNKTERRADVIFSKADLCVCLHTASAFILNTHTQSYWFYLPFYFLDEILSQSQITLRRLVYLLEHLNECSDLVGTVSKTHTYTRTHTCDRQTWGN